MVSLVSRAIGASVVLGFAFYGFCKAAENVWTWKTMHDAAMSAVERAAQAQQR